MTSERRLPDVGNFIRQQREVAQKSIRDLAKIAGVSNPYLSQIERGLRKPSAEILQQLARALQISALTLYERAGILDPQEPSANCVADAIANDNRLNAEQKHTLLTVYRSFISDPASDPGGITDPASNQAE
jgi:transcriptional regulator with XRE-family HTH domain